MKRGIMPLFILPVDKKYPIVYYNCINIVSTLKTERSVYDHIRLQG